MERHGDADVDVLLVDDVVAIDRRVDDGDRAQRLDRRFDHERRDGQLLPVALDELVLHLLARTRDVRAVDLVHGVHVR